MLSQEQALGRIFQLPAPVTVTQADLNALAAALGYDVPVSWAPPTYMFVLAEPAFTAFYTDPELELRLQNIIHVSQSFEYVRPVIPGDVLRVILTINKLQIRGEAEFITLNGVVTAADDSVVATFISVVLHRRYTVSSPNSVTQPARSARTE
ncbi:MAG: MaoC family dehydratase N-terminal domain-containing protein, partial [Propionibacteriaceae bacterium]|nr:MaoC family dehydratase N-terminal domain-containing protein [Propionibacteriaceae bacterium]